MRKTFNLIVGIIITVFLSTASLANENAGFGKNNSQTLTSSETEQGILCEWFGLMCD